MRRFWRRVVIWGVVATFAPSVLGAAPKKKKKKRAPPPQATEASAWPSQSAPPVASSASTAAPSPSGTAPPPAIAPTPIAPASALPAPSAPSGAPGSSGSASASASAAAKSEASGADGANSAAPITEGAANSAGGAPSSEDPPRRIFIDYVYGFGKIGDPSDPLQFTSHSFLAGAAYRFGRSFTVSARLPITRVHAFTRSGADNYTATALGNLELAAALAAPLSARNRLTLELGAAGLTAGGDPAASAREELSHRASEINEIASRTRVFEDNEVFASKRVSVVPRAEFVHDGGPWELSVATKLPLLVRAGGNKAPAGTSPHALGVQSVSSVGGYYYLFGHQLGLGVRGIGVVFLREGLADPYGGSKLQLAVEPGITGRFASVRAGLSYVAPIGGRLGSDVKSQGIRLMLGMVF